jgi:predicted unusual protein kinase regulating ubiquinone biosynthesis (AarF/ABC1/UbiB family)
MDWMSGIHLSEFDAKNASREVRNKIGQALWDFYMFQIHQLKKVHADPHPGNFLVSDKQELIALDFGCVKEIPEDFYTPYFELAKVEILNNKKHFQEKLYELEILRPDDSKTEIDFFSSVFHEMMLLFTKPFHEESFDFSDDLFFNKIAELGAKYAKSTEVKNMNGNRGSKHFIYINRTFFGLYNLMHDLRSDHIQIGNYSIWSDEIKVERLVS